MNKVSPWEPWFAWYPVETLSGEWVWLKDVDRRGVVYDDEFYWEYDCE